MRKNLFLISALLLFASMAMAQNLEQLDVTREPDGHYSRNSRGQILEGDGEDGKYATFFSGEKALPSHVAGSDLFWGFKKDWKGYFDVMEGHHSGVVNDYALYVVATAALVVVFTFGFMR